MNPPRRIGQTICSHLWTMTAISGRTDDSTSGRDSSWQLWMTEHRGTIAATALAIIGAGAWLASVRD